jgi:hypothetical protein
MEMPTRRIKTLHDASRYFDDANRRAEDVFLSYSGQDQQVGEAISAQLKRRFREVFDYRDGGESIPPGSPWANQIAERLSGSALGIPLYSSAYFRSGNCVNELREMLARGKNEEMLVVPVKLSQDFTLPADMSDIQALKRWEFDGESAVIAELIRVFDRWRASHPLPVPLKPELATGTASSP